MGSGSQNTQSSGQSVNQVQLPPWVNEAAQQNYGLAQNIANRPLQQYQGQQVASIGPQTQQAWNLAAGSGAAGADQYNASQAGLLTAMGTPATQVTPQTLASTNLQPYMNPYTQNVINSTLPIMQQQLGAQQAGNQAQAAGANAFGGSRMGVQQGVTQAQGALNMANMASQLNQANFGQAQGAATGDITRNLQAQQANQGANQANINSMISAAGGMGTLGSQAQQNQRQQFLELSTAGAQQQQQQQNQIAAQMGQFNNAWAYPGQQLSVLQSALGMTPYGQTTTGSNTSQQQVTTDPGIGALIQGGLQALGGMAGFGGPFGQGGMFGAPMPPGSDRHLKTDITKVGVHPPTGLPIYSYRYKGDPKSYPKVVGPMAEDAMQVAPHAVRTVGVHQPTGQAIHSVDMNALDAMPAIRPRRLPGGNGAFQTRIPGALAPTAPAGLNGALGANMRAQGLRPPGRRMPVAGGLSG
jgi:hypothetical protein